MTNRCNVVQEAIAWSRAVDGEAQPHLLDCERCRAFLEQIAALDARMQEQTDVDVPNGFADGVMSEIARRAPSPAAPSPRERSSSRRAPRIPTRTLEIALAQASLVLGLTNVLRFVLSMLVPSIALGGPR